MEKNKIIDALQGLIIRLQDAEMGYNVIASSTGIEPLKKWLNRYAKERHNMHRTLESQIAKLGGNAEVKTSILGDLHRLFIDVKINNVNHEYEFDAIVKEIDRGASVLIGDYDKVIAEVEMPVDVRKQLLSQRSLVKAEVEQLKYLKEELNAVVA